MEKLLVPRIGQDWYKTSLEYLVCRKGSARKMAGCLIRIQEPSKGLPQVKSETI